MNTGFILTNVRVLITLYCLSTLASFATRYEVGPGKTFAEAGQIAWESLLPGDTVLIHWRTNAYGAKWVLCRQGAADAPITIRGVPGPNGELPVIDGNGATTRAALNYWNQPRGVIKIGGANVPPDTTPRYITIENLDIRSARPPYSFSAANGTSTAYPNNAAAIYVETGEHITIRNCVLHDCGNGLFVAFQARDVLVEGNFIYDNGNVGSIYEHNSYTAATGITFQYNRYGPLRAGCSGNNLKDRSAGLVVRCNWIEGGNRQLDLVDGEDDPSIYTNPLYRQTFVYGNVLIEPDGAGNRQIVHYGGDSGATDIYRKGTLYFYHNTIVSTRTDRTTLFRLSTNDEQCDCRNNIIYITAAGNTLSLLDDTGRLNLTHNWLKSGWVQSFGGTSGSLTNDGSNLSGTAPGFLHEASQDFRLATNSPCIDTGANLHPDVLPANAVLRQYLKHQQGEARRNYQALDLGAYEFSPYHAWRFDHFGPGYEDSSLAEDEADPDADGIPNLLEYAFRLNPNTASPRGLPAGLVQSSNGSSYFAIQFTRRLPPSELTYTVQASTNLARWTDGSSWSDSTMNPTNQYTTVLVSGTNTVVRWNTPIPLANQTFLRVRVARE